MKIGDKVRLKNNLNRDKYTDSELGWNPKMDFLKGKLLTIIRIDSFAVELSNGNSRYGYWFFIKDINNREEKLKRILKICE
jgi:hypothetical protein